MRWLLDEMLPHAAAEILSRLGHDATSVSAMGFRQAPDSVVYQLALAENRILVTEDRGGFVPIAKADLEAGRPAVPIVIVHRDEFGRHGALPHHLADALNRWSQQVSTPWPGPHYLSA
ncbi:DUF5615 family PIN-like protein [Candidatus Poriferisodalis sp.]|uniref:DUF5615 family PIN-like protein n=1 Tax=Candidatus Poriferisodalis sp. TaxID=3101277 RepID=UPI003B5C947B